MYEIIYTSTKGTRPKGGNEDDERRWHQEGNRVHEGSEEEPWDPLIFFALDVYKNVYISQLADEWAAASRIRSGDLEHTAAVHSAPNGGAKRLRD